MKKEIKERIETVYRGEVPDGYRVESGYLIPDDWKTVPLNSRFTRSTRKNKEGCENVLTISAQMGLVNQREFYDKDIASEDKSGYFLMKNGEFAYNKSYSTGYPYGAIKQLAKYDEGIVSPLYICFAPKAGTNTAFYTQYFEGGRYNREIYRIAQEGARNHGLLNIAVEDFFTGTLVEPSAGEQQKIADILATCDRVIELKQQLLEEKRRQKQWLMYMIFEEQCLMPETTKELSFDEVFTTCSTRGHQIKTDQYVAKGLFPVVDQGKRPVVAFSDDKSKLLKCPQTGLIVFGDHTKELKFVDFDFIVGADGVQLICAKESILTTEFGYYLLSAKKLPDDGYSRHFKYLKEFTYSVPDRDTQNQISFILRGIDNEIVLLETEFELWQQKKKALMQLLLTGLVRVNA